MFVIGALPAVLAIVIRARLKEPERWKAVAAQGAEGGPSPKLGSVSELFQDPRWRRNTIIGMILALSGIVGLWGIGFFSFDLIRLVFRQHFEATLRPGLEAQGLAAADLQRQLNAAVDQKLLIWTGITSLLQNLGAFFGVYSFSKITNYVGRRPAFFLTFMLAMLSTAFTFWFLKDFSDVFG